MRYLKTGAVVDRQLETAIARFSLIRNNWRVLFDDWGTQSECELPTQGKLILLNGITLTGMDYINSPNKSELLEELLKGSEYAPSFLGTRVLGQSINPAKVTGTFIEPNGDEYDTLNYDTLRSIECQINRLWVPFSNRGFKTSYKIDLRPYFSKQELEKVNEFVTRVHEVFGLPEQELTGAKKPQTLATCHSSKILSKGPAQSSTYRGPAQSSGNTNIGSLVNRVLENPSNLRAIGDLRIKTAHTPYEGKVESFIQALETPLAGDYAKQLIALATEDYKTAQIIEKRIQKK